jgi:hypothetical protein
LNWLLHWVCAIRYTIDIVFGYAVRYALTPPFAMPLVIPLAIPLAMPLAKLFAMPYAIIWLCHQLCHQLCHRLYLLVRPLTLPWTKSRPLLKYLLFHHLWLRYSSLPCAINMALPLVIFIVNAVTQQLPVWQGPIDGRNRSLWEFLCWINCKEHSV